MLAVQALKNLRAADLFVFDVELLDYRHLQTATRSEAPAACASANLQGLNNTTAIEAYADFTIPMRLLHARFDPAWLLSFAGGNTAKRKKDKN